MIVPQNRASRAEGGRPTHRVAEDINLEYHKKADSIYNSIREYRDIKQDIFTPDQLLQILDMKVHLLATSRTGMTLYNDAGRRTSR